MCFAVLASTSSGTISTTGTSSGGVGGRLDDDDSACQRSQESRVCCWCLATLHGSHVLVYSVLV